MGEGGEIESHTDEVLRRDFIDRLFRRYLTPRESRILSLYYALDPQGRARTLAEIRDAYVDLRYGPLPTDADLRRLKHLVNRLRP